MFLLSGKIDEVLDKIHVLSAGRKPALVAGRAFALCQKGVELVSLAVNVAPDVVFHSLYLRCKLRICKCFIVSCMSLRRMKAAA